jgi:hypothetical protein
VYDATIWPFALSFVTPVMQLGVAVGAVGGRGVRRQEVAEARRVEAALLEVGADAREALSLLARERLIRRHAAGPHVAVRVVGCPTR